MTRPSASAYAIRLLAGLLDDAAVFPPGNASLSAAVTAHRRHRKAWYRDIVGPLVIPASAMSALGPLLVDGEPLAVAVTLPQGPDGIADVLDAAATLPVQLVSLEVAVPAGATGAELVAVLDARLTGTAVEVFVEVPRDERRDSLLAALAGRYRAKFRTGGIRAELYPDEAELAAAVQAAVAAGVPFKATAGLHHAVRNTDPQTGFEQHGFLNLLLAAATVLEPAAARDRVETVLAQRDAAVLAGRIRELGAQRLAAARARFGSFGTCAITEPLDELVTLGVLSSLPDREGASA